MYYDSTTLELGYETQPPREDDDDGTRTQHDRKFFIMLAIGCSLCLIASFFLNPEDVFEVVTAWSVRLCLGAVTSVCLWILHDWESRW